MSNKVYDVLKWIALVVLDAIGLFYESFSAVWGLPLGDEIHTTCTLLAVLLGTLLGISSARYKQRNTE